MNHLKTVQINPDETWTDSRKVTNILLDAISDNFANIDDDEFHEYTVYESISDTLEPLIKNLIWNITTNVSINLAKPFLNLLTAIKIELAQEPERIDRVIKIAEDIANLKKQKSPTPGEIENSKWLNTNWWLS